MPTSRIQGYPVLIIGAGRGGTALLEMFLEDNLVNVVAVVDTNEHALGLVLARQHGIRTFNNAPEALRACKSYPDCIVYNLSHDDTIADEAFKVFGDKRVTGGLEVKLFWQMVTNLKQVKTELERSQGQLQAIIHNVMDGIITINEVGEIHGFNPAAETIFGYAQQEILGRHMKILMPESQREDHDGHLQRYVHSGNSQVLGIRGREMTACRKNGTIFPMEISVSEMQLGDKRYFIGIVRDITERKLAEQKIAHLAHYDSLTDLPNRTSFLEILGHSVTLAKRNNQKVAVLFLDLDGFKAINDLQGHNAGDLLLKGVAQRLKSVLRDSDAVARVGGDEFIFVLHHIESAENAAQVAQKIITELSAPFDLDGQLSHVGASIGISLFPDNTEDIELLVKQADEAMYLSKQSGKNTSRFYDQVVTK